MKVFIENEQGSDQKHIFDEQALKFQKVVTVLRKYPYPYGFILNTKSGDGDCLDCFVLTDKPLKTGQTVDCEPIGMLEQIEDGKEDHNILAVLPGETAVLGGDTKNKLTDFVSHVFDHRKEKVVKVGRFLGRNDAEQAIKRAQHLAQSA